MRVGIVCPYSFDVPGGVQGHVIGLTKALLARGHQVSVQAPAAEDAELPEFVHPAGKALGIPTSGSVGCVGRFGEPRKGMGVLREALRRILPEFEDLRLVVVGRGDEDQLRRDAGPDLAPHLELLGQAGDDEKAQALRSVDVYCAPTAGGESFGMLLTEAMAAGTPVLASDLASFRRVLDDGHAGMLVVTGDPACPS